MIQPRESRTVPVAALFALLLASACGGGGGGNGGMTPQQPDFAITKTPNPQTVVAPGGNVDFQVAITNPDPLETITITSLVDSVFGDLAASCTDGGGAPIVNTDVAPGATATCTFTEQVAGGAGTVHQDVVTAQVLSAANVPGTMQSNTATVTVVADALNPLFDPDNPVPGASTISMQAGPVNAEDFQIEIRVTTIDDFFGAGFHVRFNSPLPASASFLGFTPGTIFQAACVAPACQTDFDVEVISAQELAVVATMQGNVAGVDNASGLLMTLSFEAVAETPGNGFTFEPIASRSVKRCPPPAGSACTNIEGTLTWSGGTLTVD
jgi:hypothetical protein